MAVSLVRAMVQPAAAARRRVVVIIVWTASRVRGQCRSCRQPIEWATIVESGKHVPLDVPVLVAHTTSGDNGRMMDAIETPSHFATCPDARAWRKRKPAKT